MIAIVTMAAFHIGLEISPSTASTMAFATLTLARLFHGFNLRSNQSIFRLGLFSNGFSVAAFTAGVILLAVVFFVPVMSRLFLVVPLTGMQFGSIVLLALIPTAWIQISRVLRGR